MVKYQKGTPISIDLTNGVTFLIYNSESGFEELQIAPFDQDNPNLARFERKDNKIKMRIYRRTDVNDKTYYVGKLKLNAKVSFQDGGSFMIWTSKENSESLQIEGKFEEI
jgi:hypothetical protein